MCCGSGSAISLSGTFYIFMVVIAVVILELNKILFLFLGQGHQYETVSGFVCEAFGYIPRTGESMKVVLEKNEEEEGENYEEAESERRENKEKSQVFKLEVCNNENAKTHFCSFAMLPCSYLICFFNLVHEAACEILLHFEFLTVGKGP